MLSDAILQYCKFCMFLQTAWMTGFRQAPDGYNFEILLSAGIAFGANTDEKTIVALIVALCFHVSTSKTVRVQQT